jgi:YD repeat-containing protein
MEIKTEFEIGQEVYYVEDNKIRIFHIDNILTRTNKDGCENIYYYDSFGKSLEERILYGDKTQLKKILIDRINKM